jgi:hypothetical protein
MTTNLATSREAWQAAQVLPPKIGFDAEAMEAICVSACERRSEDEALGGRGCGSFVLFWENPCH